MDRFVQIPMAFEMERLEWSYPAGGVRWVGAPKLWSAETWTSASSPGRYATCSGALATFVLEGGLDVEFGPDRRHVRVEAGAGLINPPRAAFAYLRDRGTRLVVLDLEGFEGDVDAIYPLAERHVSARARSLLARAPAQLDERWLRRLADEAKALDADALPMKVCQSTRSMLRVKAELDRRYRESLTLSDLATGLRMHPSYLSRQFSAHFGQAPQVYLQTLRFDHFLRRLLRYRGSLIRLAEESGFGDYPTFCRAVRDRYGAPPSALRKRLRINAGA